LEVEVKDYFQLYFYPLG